MAPEPEMETPPVGTGGAKTGNAGADNTSSIPTSSPACNTSQTAPWGNVPDALKARRAWVCWRLETRAGKPTKVPKNPATGRNAKSNDPRTWSTFADALAAAPRYDGLGIMFADGLCGVDLDHCRDPETGELEAWAAEVVAELDSYSEASPSRSGVHVLLLGDLPSGRRRKGAVEVYGPGSPRYFTVTGEHLPGTPLTVNERSEALAAVHARLIGTDAPQADAPPRPTGPLDLNDEELLAKARSARNGADFSRLWDGGYPEDDSAGDLALCSHLAFWTRGDVARVDALFRRSGRMRKKWERADYRERTIGKALEGMTEFYAPRKRKAKAPEGTEADTEREPVREHLLRLASEEGTCFRDQYGRRFFAAPVNGRREVLPLEKGGPVRPWLIARFRTETGDLPHANAVQDVLHGLDAEAWAGPERRVELRTAMRDGAYYLDLCDRERNVVRCTRDGWSIVRDVPELHFLRPTGMGALPVPDPAGNLSHLWELLPTDPERDLAEPDATRILLTAWILGAYHPEGPYPILCLSGEQGSGKSTVARLLRFLLDPKGSDHRALLNRPPREEQDLWVTALAQRVLALDNLSHLSSELSDALAALATGGAHESRKLYSDAETAFVPACRPIAMTAIGQVAVRGDLLDRSLQVSLPSIESACTERAFWEAATALRPLVLGGIMNCLCAALRHYDEVDHGELPRMADFAAWVLAMEAERDLLPWAAGEFSAVYAENRQAGQRIAADASILTGPLLDIAKRGLSGTAADLLTALNTCVDPFTRDRPEWPKSATRLSTLLNELAPALRTLGVSVARKRVQGARVIALSCYAEDD